MGILKKVLGGGANEDGPPDTHEETAPECPHTALVSHWNDPSDMGKPEKATYTCDACGQTFSYEEAREFLNQPPPPVLAASRENR